MELKYSDNCRWIKWNTNLEFHRPITATVQRQIDLKQNPNPNIVVGY
jgi:hypothetical protein